MICDSQPLFRLVCGCLKNNFFEDKCVFFFYLCTVNHKFFAYEELECIYAHFNILGKALALLLAF